jgi:uncharacterized protein (TIGR00255 family)
MTGYGRGEAGNAKVRASVELKSVNHKFLEFSFKIPAHYMAQEVELKNLLQPIGRGKVYLILNLHHLAGNTASGSLPLNTELLAAYYTKLAELATQLNAPQPRLTDLLGLPNVLEDIGAEVDEAEWDVVKTATQRAVASLVEARNQEGARLLPEFQLYCSEIDRLLDEIEPYEAARIEQLRTRMEAGLKELVAHQSFSEERFQQELFFYIEKYDIAEEKVRIRSHTADFYNTLHGAESNGRRLLFLTQELWREVNTLGNKSHQIEIQNRVVTMKETLEKMKEQLMNIV